MNYNQRNAFERYGDLRFDADSHTYTHIGRIEPLTSVTSFIASFFDPYDPYLDVYKRQQLWRSGVTH